MRFTLTRTSCYSSEKSERIPPNRQAFTLTCIEKQNNKKPRMICKQYCPVWNDIDKDCEIYGEHHFTPRTCPHYNKELKQDD